MVTTFNRAGTAGEDLVQTKKNETKNSLAMSKDICVTFMKVNDAGKMPPDNFKDVLAAYTGLKNKMAGLANKFQIFAIMYCYLHAPRELHRNFETVGANCFAALQ